MQIISAAAAAEAAKTARALILSQVRATILSDEFQRDFPRVYSALESIFADVESRFERGYTAGTIKVSSAFGCEDWTAQEYARLRDILCDLGYSCSVSLSHDPRNEQLTLRWNGDHNGNNCP